jgi:vacuolar-type H+-ATPase subunit E/Vma4
MAEDQEPTEEEQEEFEYIRAEAELELEEIVGKKRTGIGPAVGQYLWKRSEAIYRATQRRGMPMTYGEKKKS